MCMHAFHVAYIVCLHNSQMCMHVNGQPIKPCYLCLHDPSHTAIGAIRCPPLASPANGSVLFEPRLVGTTASYSCNQGNLLEGIPQRVCQQNGTWSGDQPFCLCESDPVVAYVCRVHPVVAYVCRVHPVVAYVCRVHPVVAYVCRVHPVVAYVCHVQLCLRVHAYVQQCFC